MAKRPKQGNGSSRVRFIMLEAEMFDGVLSQITNAIQNALKPPAVNGPGPANGIVKTIAAEPGDADDEAEGLEYEDIEENSPPAPTKTRRPAKRKVIADMDFESGESLTKFAEQYPPNTDQDRFPVAMT